MSHPLDPHIFPSAELIGSKARRLCRQRGFSFSDILCIEQELWLHLTAKAAEFNLAYGEWACWASFILDRQCISIWRQRNADKRTAMREAGSLDEDVPDGSGGVATRHEITPEVASDPWNRHDLERDLASVISRLPENLRAIALELAFGTPNAATDKLGISRRSMTKAMDQIREIFRDAELDRYL